jgi:hypothetical protein
MIITNIEIIGQDGEIQETVIIDNENGSFTSMLKSTYDEQQAEHFTPMVTDGN